MQTLFIFLSWCLLQVFAQNTTSVSTSVFDNETTTVSTSVFDNKTTTVSTSVFDNETTTNSTSVFDNETTTVPLNCSDPSYHVQIQCVDILLQGQSSLIQLLIVAIVSGIWILYLTFFNSRLVGLIITKVANNFLKDVYFHIGSFSVSVLSGKLMFRNISYITKNYSLRVNDGYIIFRWWRPYRFTQWPKQHELSHGHTRLSVVLYGLTFHIYNNSAAYDELHKHYGQAESAQIKKESITKKIDKTETDQVALWRTLFPVIKFSISHGKVVVGNRLLPNKLVVAFTEGDLQYKTTEPSNSLDLFLHVVEGTLKSAQLMLIPTGKLFDANVTPQMLNISNEYKEDPPRNMGDGYVVINSNTVTIKYVWDEPGIVPLLSHRSTIHENFSNSFDTNRGDEALLLKAKQDGNQVNNTPVTNDTAPMFEMVVHFGKRTIFNFSPWADRQREIIWNFFYPPEYQALKATEPPKPGDRRYPLNLKISAMLVNGADLDLLYSKKGGIGAMQIHSSEGSFVEINVPMVVEENGYTTWLSGQLLHPDISTSLHYRSFLNAEMFGFDIKSHYPRQWNALQTWDCNITVPKASLSLLFCHKDFIGDIMYDWSYKSPLDFMFFIPYNFNIHIELDGFELYLPLNKHNWIDCQSKPTENAYLALYGQQFTLDFVIPNECFLPPVSNIPFDFQMKDCQLCAFLPESNTTRNTLHSLANHQKLWANKTNDPNNLDVDWDRIDKKKWGLVNSDWVVVGEIPSLSLNLEYTWHAIITPYESQTINKFTQVPFPQSQHHEAHEPSKTPSKGSHNERKTSPKVRPVVTFDPTCLDADTMALDVSIPSGSVIVLYGSLVDLVVAFKDNYLGYDDIFTDFAMNQQNDVELKKSTSHGDENNFLYYRPFEVTVNVNIQDLSAILPMHFSKSYISQPKVKLNQLLFEMKKKFLQTRLQLFLDQLEINVAETTPSIQSEMKLGKSCSLCLSELQLRGHAMFSNAGLPPGSISVEYAWLTEVLVGDIKGMLSMIQLQAILDWVENFVFLSANDAYQLERAFPFRLLPTGMNLKYKKQDGTSVEETDVKYQMTRLRLQSVHLRLAQDKTVFDCHISPVTLANGNVQKAGVAEAWSVALQEIKLKHYVSKPNKKDEWLEAGEVRMGPILTQVSVATKEKGMSAMQIDFLRHHDKKTRRLFFLWDPIVAGAKASNTYSLLEKVKSLKSWGCSFFAPMADGQPMFFFSKPSANKPSTQEDLSSSDETDEDEDVFDPKMDFGMSILVDGKILVTRTNSPKPKEKSHPPATCLSSTSSSSSSDTSSSDIPASEVRMESKYPTEFRPKPSKFLLDRMEGFQSESDLEDEISVKAQSILSPPSVTIQIEDELDEVDDAEVSDTTESLQVEQSPSVSGENSAPASGTSSTALPVQSKPVLTDLNQSVVSNQTLLEQLASNEINAITKSPLSSSLPKISDQVRAASPDTPLFQSVDSELKMSSRTSSESDNFYSAESDVENLDPIAPSPAASDPGVNITVTDKNVESEEQLVRPGHLEFHQKRGSIIRKLDLSPDEEGIIPPSSTSPLPKKRLIKEKPNGNTELTTCYSHLLASTKIKDSDWLSEFEIIEDGVHPSVVIEKPDIKSSKLLRRSSNDVFRVATDEHCTSVILHIKGGVDVQTSPFLLDSAQQLINAITATAKERHPSSVISRIQAKCTSDAVADHHLDKQNEENAISGVLASALGQLEGSRTKLKIYMDLVRVNLVQATPGDDAVFNLRLNKMLPTPCLTIATIRLDRLDICAQLNSKKEKLLSKARTKAHLSQSVDTDPSTEGDTTPASNRNPIVILSAHASVDSLACQLRVLSQDGCAPERSNVIALRDEACRSPFQFDSNVLLPRVKDAIENYANLQRCPPKPWGWVMFEAGINSISAELLGRDVPVKTVGVKRKHMSEGHLNIESIWLNAVAPQSLSQMSKSNRAYRSWNLLTAIAPSCCAWLAPADRIAGASQLLDDVTQTQYFTSISAALTLASLSPDKNLLRLSKTSKYMSMLTDISKAIKRDPSCVLCDALQRHFVKNDHVRDLEAAFLDGENLPTTATLELSIQIALGLLLDCGSSASRKKLPAAKLAIQTGDPSTVTPQIKNPGIKYDGTLEMSTLLREKKDSTKAHSVSHTPPERDEADKLITNAAKQQAENVVLEQQQSMYSWMMHQRQDIEAQLDRGKPDEPITDQSPPSDSLIREVKLTYFNFLCNLGAMELERSGPNLARSLCEGGLNIKAAIAKIKMEKQNPDRIYMRDAGRRRRQRSVKRRRSHSGESPPIVVCQNLQLNVSLLDTPVTPVEGKSSGHKGKRNTSSNNNVNKSMKGFVLQKYIIDRSKLSADITCSINFVKQRIDIALVRLVHQFQMCAGAIQQAMTDIQVNKYTEGALSPDMFAGHRRGFSNISANLFRSSSAHDAFMGSTRRRNTLPPAAYTQESDSDSSSEESISASPCWQEVYRLVDLHRADSAVQVHNRRSEIVKVESDLRRRFSTSGNVSSFVSLELSASVKLEKVQLLAEVGDLWISIILHSLDGAVKHIRKAVSAFKNEGESSLNASLEQINAEVSSHVMHNRKNFLTSHVGLCRFEAFVNHSLEGVSDNTCSLVIGKVMVELPQRPSTIHDIVSRGSKRINVHLQEFVTTPSFKAPADLAFVPPRLVSASPSLVTLGHQTPKTPSFVNDISAATSAETTNELPLDISFELSIEGVEIGANMLPSSLVRYTTEAITGSGEFGKESSFNVKLLQHAIHFTSSVTSTNEGTSTTIPFPQIVAEGEMKDHHYDGVDGLCYQRKLYVASELKMKEGEYMSVSINIGSFEHTLNTSLFNQLIFLEEALVEEVENILMKISSDRGAAMTFSETSIKSTSQLSSSHTGSHASSRLLYQLQLQLDGIQLTAVTPSQNAVRLKTGTMTFELSNRVVRAGQKLQNIPKYMKIFGKAQVDISLGLGTLIDNSVYPEMEPEFQQLAYFTTRIGLQNTTQIQEKSTTHLGTDRPSVGGKLANEDNSVILINLTRPIFFVQPTAFDKAILFFLVYKNHYEEWVEKRELVERSPSRATPTFSGIPNRSSLGYNAGSTSAPSNLFLQICVNDLGICLPVSRAQSHQQSDRDELSSALVLTIDNTMISACYARSLVSAGQFRGFCLRFADDFQTSWDDWAPKTYTANSFLVPDGTYQICTDTTSYQGIHMRARTSVNVVWKMKGMDVKLDTKIGSYLTTLVDTMTIITGNQGSGSSDSSEKMDSETYDDISLQLDYDDVDSAPRKRGKDHKIKRSPSDPTVKERFWREKSRKLEHQYNEQANLIRDLRSLGAKPTTVQEEEDRLHELEGELSSLFRRTVKHKLRRSSVRTSQTDARYMTHQRSISSGLARAFSPIKPVQSAFATLPSFNYPSRPELNIPHSAAPRPSFHKRSLGESTDDSSDLEEGLDMDTVDGVEEDGTGTSPFQLGQEEQNIITQQQSELAGLELILDLDVGIDGGKIVCQPAKDEFAQLKQSSKNSSHLMIAMNPSDTAVWGIPRLCVLQPVQLLYCEGKLRSLVNHIRVCLLPFRLRWTVDMRANDNLKLSSSTASTSSRFTTLKSYGSNETVFYVPGVSVKCRYNSGAGEVVDAAADSSRVPLVEVETPGGTKFLKRSSIYIWFSLQSLPEMIISPCFLDFLEQTLQAIPVKTTPETSPSEEGLGAVDSLDSTIAALPMDTLVFVSIQPSQVLFNCQPMSRVECLLHIPSLNATFSNIRHAKDNQGSFTFPQKSSKSEGSQQSFSGRFTKDKKSESSQSLSGQNELKNFPSGMAITVVMSDFSIYVFHPYGSQVASGAAQKPGSGRKDSLSVDLEVVRFNIVRTKKGTAQMNASFRTKEKATVVNISTLMDIGKACFKYDMRRLSEILAFPRAWYRRSIARRLFFGDTTEDNLSASKSTIDDDSPLMPIRNEAKKETVAAKEEWVSVLLYCLKMSRLDVQMNMSNVMGNTLWSCDGLRSQGKLSIQSSGDQDLFLSCGLQNSQLNAKGGIIGGHIELQKLYANCRLLEPVLVEPRHRLCVMMRSLDGRIEYMGGCIMMGKLTDGKLKLSDEWKGPALSIPTSVEKSSIFVPGDFKWNNFSIAISRSTTPDVIKMLAKLEEFFTLQFHNSVRALSSLTQPTRRDVTVTRQASASQQPAYTFHRHWPSVYNVMKSRGIIPNFLLGGSFCLHGNHLTIVCFHGNNFRSRAWLLFNILEPNIMFSTEVQEIKESVSGDEVSTLSNQSLTFNLGNDYWLKTSTASSDPMATVSRVTRSRNGNPPSLSASIDEWFAYITASHTQELSMLRTLNDLGGREKERTKSPAGGAKRSTSSSSYSHDTDIIFALPKLQLDFKTEHAQGAKEPDPNGSEKPVVDCTFVTEFTDHICVTMDVELIMCLHDLISSYLKEKQQALSTRSTRLDQATPVGPIDPRQFNCNTWQLEPTVRLISWAGRRIEPVGVDYILHHLGFTHARTTIPKWFQRGVLDVLDQTLAVIVQNLVVAMHQRKKI